MDGLRCKPDELAIITGGRENSRGTLVRTLVLHPEASAIFSKTMWQIELLSSAVNPFGERIPAGTIAFAADANLTPLRGDPLEEPAPPIKEPIPCLA